MNLKTKTVMAILQNNIEHICDALGNLVHLYNLINVKNTHGVMLAFVKLQLYKSNTYPWVFSTLFILYKWAPNRGKHQIQIYFCTSAHAELISKSLARKINKKNPLC